MSADPGPGADSRPAAKTIDAADTRQKTPPASPPQTLRDLQKTVDHWIRRYGVRYFSELTNLAVLVEEVGELARLMARVYGDQSFKSDGAQPDLGDELADVLFVLVCIANQTGIDLESALERNLQKKTSRDRDRHRRNPKLTP